MGLLADLGWTSWQAYRDWNLKRQQPPRPEVHGLRLYVGLPGQGKTISVVDDLNTARVRWGSDIDIGSNFGWRDQDFEITTWRDMTKKRTKPTLMGIDELGMLVNSREWGDFPPELILLLTQRRKWNEGAGVGVIGTVQKLWMVDKYFRELAEHIVEVRTLAGRLTTRRWYEGMDYERGHKWREEQLVMEDRIRLTDELFAQYDTFYMIERVLARDPVIRLEQARAQAQEEMVNRFWEGAGEVVREVALASAGTPRKRGADAPRNVHQLRTRT